MPVVNFKIFSSDATGTPPDPDTAGTVIELGFPKGLRDKGAESIFQAPPGRGSVHETLSSAVVQDFGIPSNFAGGQIFIDDIDALTDSKRSALETAYLQEETSWYFTDGVDVYEVQFSRNPVGFHAWLNYAIYSATGTKYFSYLIQLIITEKVT